MKDVRQAVSESNSDKLTNPPAEEKKEETEQGQKSTVEKADELERPVLQVYQEGNEANKDKRSKESGTHPEKALQIVKTLSFYLSQGNSKMVTSDYGGRNIRI